MCVRAHPNPQTKEIESISEARGSDQTLIPNSPLQGKTAVGKVRSLQRNVDSVSFSCVRNEHSDLSTAAVPATSTEDQRRRRTPYAPLGAWNGTQHPEIPAGSIRVTRFDRASQTRQGRGDVLPGATRGARTGRKASCSQHPAASAEKVRLVLRPPKEV